VPIPVLFTFKSNLKANVAVTLLADVMLTVHCSLPAHAPDQPVNTLPSPGLAVRVIFVPVWNAAVHAEPQSMPEGVDVIKPNPLPALLIVKLKVGTNVAVTDLGEFICKTQSTVPEHASPQPLKA
jgi:hypothetical protein